MTAFIITRIDVGDYDRWRPQFDQDRPRAREAARVQRVLRSVDVPNHVFIYLEFDALEDAQEAKRRLLESRVLDRFEDVHGPNVLVDADDALPARNPSPSRSGPSSGPNESVTLAGVRRPARRGCPVSCSRAATACSSTTLRSNPCRRQAASMLAVLPPQTRTTSCERAKLRKSSGGHG